MSRVADAIRRAAAARETDDQRIAPDASATSVARNPWNIDERDETGALVEAWPEPDRSSGARAPDLDVRRQEPDSDPPRRQIGGAAACGAYDDLVQRLFRPGTGEPTARTVLFIVFGGHTEGGQVVLDVADALAAHRAGSLCVVDASFGACGLPVHRPAGPGFCDAILSSTPASACATPIGADVWLIESGVPMPDQASWVPAAAARALRQLTGCFEFVIAAASDAHSSTATLVALAGAADGVVLIVEAERTRRDRVAALVMRLQEAGAQVFGVVLEDGRRRTGSAERRKRKQGEPV